ncbi:MAG: RNA polymerase sigma factor [Candidatus Poribacteria bacterium]|nr:RNA polymerase sigma factor [Candidatus Poribacteria bacterium]
MENFDNATLARLSALGSECAFGELIRRHERQLAALIQYQLGNRDDAEDVLQETLMQAWVGIRHLREPKTVGRWLLRIARNRCYDFLKSAQRRDQPMEDGELTQFIDRFGHRQFRRTHLFNDAVAALEEIPNTERKAAQLFYLEGFTIAEIAARSRCAEGTVKRRLFQARARLRQSFGVSNKRRKIQMQTHKPRTKKQPFPVRRPEVVITQINTEPFSVDCPELRCWFIVPKIGERSLYANYDPMDWKLTEVYELQVVRQSRVHDMDGVEIDVHLWISQTGWMPSTWQMYGRLAEERVEYLAVSQLSDGTRILYTFLDKDFDFDWGGMPRRLEDKGRFESQADGSLKQVHGVDNVEASGAGLFSVAVGERRFSCLRIIELDVPVEKIGRDFSITESYITEVGRTVLVRHFCHPERTMYNDQGICERVILDKDVQIVVDGVTFVHWYDSISNLAFGF